MKIFFDTNVLIAAFIARGACNDLFEYCLSEHRVYISQWVIDEFQEKLLQKFHFPKIKVEQAVKFLRENTIMTNSTSLGLKICRDQDDNYILGSAIDGRVDFIISGDKDLTELKNVQGISILKPSEFWMFERERK